MASTVSECYGYIPKSEDLRYVLTDAAVAAAREMRESGMSYRKIAAILGCAHNTIRCRLDAEEAGRQRERQRRYRETHAEDKDSRNEISRRHYRRKKFLHSRGLTMAKAKKFLNWPVVEMEGEGDAEN